MEEELPVKPVYQVIRDLEFAARQGDLTPSFLDAYARRHGEKVLALYGLAARNDLAIAHEEGRNDHVVEKPWDGVVDTRAVEQALDDGSSRVIASVHAAHEDGRPTTLRRPGRNAFYPIKRAG